MKTKEARAFKGKYVEWDTYPESIAFPKRRGLVIDVKNRNALIGIDWYWLPNIKEFKVIKE